MKTRIVALALAIAFVAAPALAALAGAECMPCGDMAQGGDAPCTSLSAASCCGDVAPAAPAQTALDLSSAHAIAVAVPVAPLPLPIRAPDAAPWLAAAISALRLSVVRLL